MSLNYILRAKKFKAKKSLGQNFLIDDKIIDFIIYEKRAISSSLF